MISWFPSPTVGGTLLFVGFWLLGIILLYAWAVFITKRLRPKSLPAEHSSQASENPKQGTARHYEPSKRQKTKSQFRICRLLSSCCDIVKDKSVRYPTHNSREQCKQPAQRVEPKNFRCIRVILQFPISHIRTIVNKLQRGVNH